MPNIKFEVDNRKYNALLTREYVAMRGENRKICHCILTATNPIRTFSGVAVKHPHDGLEYDEQEGFRLAFKRAIFQMFIVDEITEKHNISKAELRDGVVLSWVSYWHKYRKQFGKALHDWFEDV